MAHEKAVLVNESQGSTLPGDVSLFRNAGDAENYLEPIDVSNNEYTAFSLDGRWLDLAVVNGRVQIRPALVQEDHRDQVRLLLEYAGKASLQGRRSKGSPLARLSPSDMSVEELIQLIGFTR